MDDGHIVVDSVESITMSDITDDLARESGFDSADDLLQTARHGGGSHVYLIRFHYLAPGAWDIPPSPTAGARDRPTRGPRRMTSVVKSLRNRMKSFRVSQIDHVELFVPDRDEAADWYKRTLGLEIVPGYQRWAADPRGPLMISSDEGSTKLALFERQPQVPDAASGWHLVAFRVDADGFIEFVKRLADRPLIDDQERAVTVDSVADHDKAFSVYFIDPYGHRLEVTTYEYEATRAALAQLREMNHEGNAR